MPPPARRVVQLACVLALVACKRPRTERQAAPADAGPPTLTGAPVPAGRADAGGEAAGPPTLTGATVPAERADAGEDAKGPALTGTTGPSGRADASAPDSEAVRVQAFGATVEDAGGDRGATVTRLVPGSQAASVLRPGDVITAVDLVRVRSADELGRYMEKARRGIVVLTVEREGTSRYIVVTPD